MWHFIQNFTSKMKKEKILRTQTKQQVAFVQSSLTSKSYSLHRETSFKTFDSFLSNLKQKQICTSSKLLHPKSNKQKRKGRATFVKIRCKTWLSAHPNEKTNSQTKTLFKVVWPQKIILYIVKQVSKLLTHF